MSNPLKPRKFNHTGGRRWQQSPHSAPVMLPEPEASQTRLKIKTSASLLSGNDSSKAQIQNVEYVASFSWLDTPEPTILVPGTPPRWQPHKTTQKLHEDKGDYYRDPNSARFPSFPTEPAIRAICEQVPGFDLSEIDVFGCGNTLGSLLCFIRDEDRTFRFGVEYVGSSLFLVRKTNKPAELIEGIRGYGHTFPESYTQWDKDVKNSASYQRIIKYDFAGLKCFVRSESDGYLPDFSNEAENLSQSSESTQQTCYDGDGLLDLSLGHQTPLKSDKLILQQAGQVIPQSALFDLKTRSLKSKRDDVSVEAFLHRLWINQTPNMILAYHNRGTFEPSHIHVTDARSKVVEWEADNAAVPLRFGALLHWLIDVAKRESRSCFEVRRVARGSLEIWSEVPGWSALSLNLKQQLGVGSVSDKTATDRNETDHGDD